MQAQQHSFAAYCKALIVSPHKVPMCIITRLESCCKTLPCLCKVHHVIGLIEGADKWSNEHPRCCTADLKSFSKQLSLPVTLGHAGHHSSGCTKSNHNNAVDARGSSCTDTHSAPTEEPRLTIWSRKSFFSARCSTRSSTVPAVHKRYAWTGLVWPMRCTLAMACRSHCTIWDTHHPQHGREDHCQLDCKPIPVYQASCLPTLWTAIARYIQTSFGKGPC